MELLPLVEMFCRWELLEDCNDLQGLLVRFDSEAELESHELGRALLFMIRNDDSGLPTSSPRVHPGVTANVAADPFETVRERLAAVDSAIRTLQPQVLAFLGCGRLCAVPWNLLSAWNCAYVACRAGTSVPLQLCPPRCNILIQITVTWLICRFSSTMLQTFAPSQLALLEYHYSSVCCGVCMRSCCGVFSAKSFFLGACSTCLHCAIFLPQFLRGPRHAETCQTSASLHFSEVFPARSIADRPTLHASSCTYLHPPPASHHKGLPLSGS